MALQATARESARLCFLDKPQTSGLLKGLSTRVPGLSVASSSHSKGNRGWFTSLAFLLFLDLGSLILCQLICSPITFRNAVSIVSPDFFFRYSQLDNQPQCLSSRAERGAPRLTCAAQPLLSGVSVSGWWEICGGAPRLGKLVLRKGRKEPEQLHSSAHSF